MRKLHRTLISRELIAVAVILALLAGATAATAQTYGGAPGAVTINGQAVGGANIPVITDSTPTFAGQVDQSGGTVNLLVQTVPQNTSTTADASGNFSASFPLPIEDGTHTLYVNNVLVGQFTIAAGAVGGTQEPQVQVTPTAGATPAPPSTGSGSGGSDAMQWSILAALGAGLLLASGYVGIAAARRKDAEH